MRNTLTDLKLRVYVFKSNQSENAIRLSFCFLYPFSINFEFESTFDSQSLEYLIIYQNFEVQEAAFKFVLHLNKLNSKV